MSWKDKLPKRPPEAQRTGRTTGGRIDAAIQSFSMMYEGNSNLTGRDLLLVGLYIALAHPPEAQRILDGFIDVNFEDPDDFRKILEANRLLIIEDLMFPPAEEDAA